MVAQHIPKPLQSSSIIYVEPTAPGRKKGKHRPSPDALRQFHRGEDSYVTLHRKPTEDSFQNLGAFSPYELETIFPDMREELSRDSFFSINSYGIPLSRGKSHCLRYLNAVYADFDCYQIPAPEALGKLVQAMAENVVPPASIFGISGRGVWAFWLLRDVDDPDIPQRAFPEKRLLYAKVQRALHDRLKKNLPELRPDGAALDLVRITRVPYSVNSKSGEKVLHFQSLTEDGRPRLYTLNELRDVLYIAERKPQAKILRFGKRVPARLAGWVASWKKRLQWFEKLRDLRGGFAEGQRNSAVYIFSILLRKLGLPEAEIYVRVTELGSQCRPPLPEAEVLGVILSSQSSSAKIHMSTAQMRAVLEPSPDELSALAPFAPKGRATRARSRKREERIRARRVRILAVIHELGEVPTAQDLVRVLAGEGYLGSSRSNVLCDLEVLGMASPRKRRPRIRSKQVRLPAI